MGINMDTETLHQQKMPPEFYKYLSSLFLYLKSTLNLKSTPKVKLVCDKNNAMDILGKTGYYDQNTNTVVLYVEGRHMKDQLRSFSHEVIHHWQNEHGSLNSQSNDPQYAQHDPHMRKMEMQAYLLGNILFRDWSDIHKYGDKDQEKITQSIPPHINENFQLDGEKLKSAVKQFSNYLVSDGVITSFQRDKTGGNMNPSDFTNDLVHKLTSSIQEWIKLVNDRNNWENDEGGMIREEQK